MSRFDTFGKIFVAIGIIFLLIGGALQLSKHIPFLGKLPGDILIEKRNFTLYIPVTTSILLSLILTLIFYLFTKR
jgi:hypothetical protein